MPVNVSDHKQHAAFPGNKLCNKEDIYSNRQSLING
jgi:hypothetical protein